MTDPLMNQWIQSGKVYLWTYLENTKNFPGWHICVDQNGGDSLLDLLEKMLSAVWPSTKEILISPPTLKILKRPNNKNGKAKWSSPKIFKIKFPKGKVPHDHWSLLEGQDRVDLVIGMKKLNQLRRGIEDSLLYRGDYSIGSEENFEDDSACLWFW